MSKACLNYSITQHPHQMTQSPPLMLLSLPVIVKMLPSRYNTCRMDLVSQVSSQSPSLGFQLCDPWRWLDVDMGLIQIPATICGWEWAPTSGWKWWINGGWLGEMPKWDPSSMSFIRHFKETQLTQRHTAKALLPFVNGASIEYEPQGAALAAAGAKLETSSDLGWIQSCAERCVGNWARMALDTKSIRNLDQGWKNGQLLLGIFRNK